MLLKGYCARCHMLHTWGFKTHPEDKGTAFEVSTKCPLCGGVIEMKGKDQ